MTTTININGDADLDITGNNNTVNISSDAIQTFTVNGFIPGEGTQTEEQGDGVPTFAEGELPSDGSIQIIRVGIATSVEFDYNWTGNTDLTNDGNYDYVNLAFVGAVKDNNPPRMRKTDGSSGSGGISLHFVGWEAFTMHA